MKQKVFRPIAALVLSLALFPAFTQTAYGYSVLTHEAIIDSAWEDSIKPLLLKRFPTATTEQLREAHAYAYGGAIIQDMGYYPFGSKLFTDLAHYVRSGDFIEALIKESSDLNEYAFSLGALAHLAADNQGHSIAINHSVPILYPKLQGKYGDVVTYVESPSAHIKTEFGFDVLQVARGHYAPENYQDFIGFQVAKHVLERAFLDTYGFEMKDLFADLDFAIGTYRFTAGTLIPQMTKVAWETKKDDIENLTPGITNQRFRYNLSRASYEQKWGKQYDKPGFLSKTLACLLRIIPKIGPLDALAFKPATAETERLFIASFNATLTHYRAFLSQVPSGHLQLPNSNFDIGKPTQAGEYSLADETYAKLLEKLAHRNFCNVPPALRQNILAFYGDLSAPIATKKDKSNWRKTLREIAQLKVADGQPAYQRAKN